MGSYAIEDIEDGFITLLQPLKTAGTVRTLETYGGQLNEETVERAALRFPAVYVIWNGFDAREMSRSDEETHRISVLFAHRNLRGEAAARRGAAGDAEGVYDIMKEARELLRRQAPMDAPGWGLARLTRCGPIAYAGEGTLAVYEQLYELRAVVSHA